MILFPFIGKHVKTLALPVEITPEMALYVIILFHLYFGFGLDRFLRYKGVSTLVVVENDFQSEFCLKAESLSFCIQDSI